MAFDGIDRESIVADATGGRYDGRVYITGETTNQQLDGADGRNGMGVWVSQDSGVTFGEPLKRNSPGARYTLGVGNSTILSDGTLVSLFSELKQSDGRTVERSARSTPNATLEVITSSDGGETLTPAVKVGDYFMRWPLRNTSGTPTLAADPGGGPFKDRLYVVWADERDGRSEIWLAYSANKGTTWSEPVQIDDDENFPDGTPGPDDFMPTVAVNRAGVVGVMWYDRRAHPDNLGWDVRFRTSLDGGETWLPSVKVSGASNTFAGSAHLRVQGWGSGVAIEDHGRTGEGSLTVRAEVLSRQFYGGDYAGLAADAGNTFHAFWVDNRTGVSQIWTAPVVVRGQAVRNGDPLLASLADVSNKLVMSITSIAFDRRVGTVTMTARLENTSRDTLYGPFYARVLGMRSQFASEVHVAGAANGQNGAGAVFNLGVADGAAFVPGQISPPTPLRFMLTGLRPLTVAPLAGGTEPHVNIVDMKARILAGPATTTRQKR